MIVFAVVAVALLLGCGYVLGRTRPWYNVRDWARWNIRGFGPQSKTRSVVALTVMGDDVLRSWHRHKNAGRTPKVKPIYPRRRNHNGF